MVSAAERTAWRSSIEGGSVGESWLALCRPPLAQPYSWVGLLRRQQI